MNDFPRLWNDLFSLGNGLPLVVNSVQKIMDAKSHPDHISIHSEFELVYLQEIDRGSFYIDKTSVKVHTNDLILIKPNVPHYLKIECSKPCRFIVLKFSFTKVSPDKYSNISVNDFLSFISERNDNNNFFMLSTANCGHISEITQRILHEDKFPDNESDFLKSLLTIELFVWLSRNLRAQWEINLVTKGNKLQEILESAKLFIEQNYNSDISLSDIAGFVYISTSHFARAFKKYYNISPIQYLLKVRIDNAKTLLEETNLKVGEISSAVGFGAQQRFNDIFKKQSGLSPGEYRQQYAQSLLK